MLVIVLIGIIVVGGTLYGVSGIARADYERWSRGARVKRGRFLSPARVFGWLKTWFGGGD